MLLDQFTVVELFSACTVSVFTYFHAKHCLASLPIHSSLLLLSLSKQQIGICRQWHFPLIHFSIPQHSIANVYGKSYIYVWSLWVISLIISRMKIGQLVISFEKSYNYPLTEVGTSQIFPDVFFSSSTLLPYSKSRMIF